MANNMQDNKISKVRLNSLSSLKVIFYLSLRQLFWSKRSLLIFFIAAFPPGIAALTLLVKLAGWGSVSLSDIGLFSVMMFLIFLQFLVLIVPLFYGSALIPDEIEKKTLTYLFISPISKAVILLGKYFALVFISSLVVIISGVSTYLILLGQKGTRYLLEYQSILWKDIGVLVLAIFCYGALFTFLGARFKHPIIIGLLFSFGWESVICYVPGQIKKLTIMHFLQSVYPHKMFPSDVRGLLAIFHEATSFWPSIITLIAICLVFLLLSLITLYNKEYHLET